VSDQKLIVVRTIVDIEARDRLDLDSKEKNGFKRMDKDGLQALLLTKKESKSPDLQSITTYS